MANGSDGIRSSSIVNITNVSLCIQVQFFDDPGYFIKPDAASPIFGIVADTKWTPRHHS